MKKVSKYLIMVFVAMVVYLANPSTSNTVFAASLDPQFGSLMKTVQAGEQIRAIDSRNGWWLIAHYDQSHNLKLGWCNAGQTSYYNSNTNTVPILLCATQSMNIYEAVAAHYYKNGDPITVESGSVSGWWKVKTPEGYDAWVNAGPTTYKGSQLVSSSSTPLPAYYTAGEAPTAGLTVTSVNPINLSTTKGANPSLPSIVNVTLSNGTTANAPITWSQSAYSTATYNTTDPSVVISGALSSYGGKVVNATVKVVQPGLTVTSVNPINLSTTNGVIPSLPSTVNVTLSNGTTANASINWSSAASIATTYATTASTVLVNGTLSSCNNYPVTAIVTMLGNCVKKLQVNEQIKAIDSKPGFWLIAESGKLFWANAGPTSYWDSNTSTFPVLLRVTQSMNTNEASVVHYYKYGDKISRESGSVDGWWKVKTPEGYDAWVNAGPTGYDKNNNLVSTSSIPLAAYSSVALNKLQYVKTVQAKEQIKAIDSTAGLWLIAEGEKLCWVNAGPTSYWNLNTSTFPVLLSARQNMNINEAAVVHYYNYGDRITLQGGAVDGWWKVITPEGYSAWVNAGPTEYDKNNKLISTSSKPLAAYYVVTINTDNNTNGRSYNLEAPSAPNNVKAWMEEAMTRTKTSFAYENDLLTIAYYESSDNPNAINLWDSNAKAGHPSKGLMQVIDPTFQEYRDKNLPNNICDPVANIVAAINYMIGRYKSIANVPGIISLEKYNVYKGY